MSIFDVFVGIGQDVEKVRFFIINVIIAIAICIAIYMIGLGIDKNNSMRVRLGFFIIITSLIFLAFNFIRRYFIMKYRYAAGVSGVEDVARIL